MRIAYLTNQYPAVSHTFIRREVLAVEGHGVEVIRVAVRRPRESLVDPADREEMERTRYLLDGGWRSVAAAIAEQATRHPLRTLAALVRCIRLGWRAERGLLKHLIYLGEACLLASWLRAEKVEHVHVHFGTNPAAVALLCRALGGPSFSITIHGPEEFLRPEAMRIADKSRDAEFVVGISGYGVRRLREIAGDDAADRVHLVRCGIGPEFRSVRTCDIADEPRLVCVGRLCEAKQQEVLVRAAAELAGRGVKLDVLLVGDGPCRPRLEQVAKELNAPVRFAGSLSGEAVRRALRESRAMVLPSRAEGLPVAIMEAFALERPVISTPVGGIAELVLPGVNGWLVPPGSVSALAAAMEEVLRTDPARLREMGRAGRRLVLARHDVEREAAVLAGLFRRATQAVRQHAGELLGVPSAGDLVHRKADERWTA